jgi:pantetheine-phosphate adenylyltransferase
MKRIAVFPGTFDPFTIGHQSIVSRALPLFDKIIIAIGVNSSKQAMFSLEQRKRWINESFPGESKISIDSFSGLTVNYCLEKGANYILRGLRSSADFNYERAIAQMNHAMRKEIETVFIMSLPEHSAISSTILRDILRNNGNVDAYVPSQIKIDDSK